jgi:hypothetical protein
MRAVQAASESTAFVDNDLLMSLEKVVVHARDGHLRQPRQSSGLPGSPARLVFYRVVLGNKSRTTKVERDRLNFGGFDG